MIITTDKVMRPRDALDHYPTPISVCRAALDLLPPMFTPYEALDPGAGTGVWGRVLRERQGGCWIDGVEVDRSHQWPNAYDSWHQADFLTWDGSAANMGSTWMAPYDLVFGNPPYKYAEAFVRRALALTKSGGYVLFLLRLAFLEGQARGAGLWQEAPPERVAVCSARPSFTGNGKTDATAYAIYLWRKGRKVEPALTWLKEAA
jgi:hypothetical protein